MTLLYLLRDDFFKLLDIGGLEHALQFGIVDSKVNRAVGNVELDAIAFLDETDRATLGRFRRDVADRQARRSAREASVGDKSHRIPEAFADESGSGRKQNWFPQPVRER